MSEQSFLPILLICGIITILVMIKSKPWARFWQALAGAAIVWQIIGMVLGITEHLPR
jgi:hypothetical protein